MEGKRVDVAERLTRLASLPDVVVSDKDRWQPSGRPVHKSGSWDTTPSDEVDFARPNDLVPPETLGRLQTWWLVVQSPRTRMPTWDLVATCTIRDSPGLLLVEAKAYDRELSVSGKTAPTSSNGRRNHERIGVAIEEANRGLALANGRPWALSRDSHYQLSNRFAWAWKLASLGVPVVLVYLGFLNAVEMTDRGSPFESGDKWDSILMDHSSGLVHCGSWDEWLEIGDVPMIPVVRSYDQPFEPGLH